MPITKKPTSQKKLSERIKNQIEDLGEPKKNRKSQVKNKTRKTTAYLPEDLFERFDTFCKENYLSHSNALVQAVKYFLDNKSEK